MESFCAEEHTNTIHGLRAGVQSDKANSFLLLGPQRPKESTMLFVVEATKWWQTDMEVSHGFKFNRWNSTPFRQHCGRHAGPHFVKSYLWVCSSMCH